MMNVEITQSISEFFFCTIQLFVILHTDVILKTSLLNLRIYNFLIFLFQNNHNKVMIIIIIIIVVILY